jgi:RHS repeat-associated protein
MRQRTDDDGTTVWTYDTSENGIGQLATTTSPDGHVEQMFYDDRARLEAVETTVEGQTFRVETVYDVAGRVREIRYPGTTHSDPFGVWYNYDRYGNLHEVHDLYTDLVYWEAKGVNSFGQVDQEKFGNGVATNRQFGVKHGLPESIVTTSPSGEVIQALRYAYDANLNVKNRWDDILPSSEVFFYDELNRLRRVEGCLGPPGGFQFCPTQTFEYDAIGNITLKNGAVYTYDAAQPHAVTSAGKSKYGYDGNGNQVSRPGVTIDYSSFNMPTRFTRASGAIVDLEYTAGQQRLVKRSLSNVVRGDLNTDGVVDQDDFDALVDALQLSTPAPGADINGDGMLSDSDLSTLVGLFGNSSERGSQTIYIGGVYELRTSIPQGQAQTHVYNVVANGRIIAQVERQVLREVDLMPVSIVETIKYIHDDHQGSTNLVTDNAGKVLTRVNYDAFGRPRDDTWSPLSLSDESSIHSGFTGHEHDDEIGLINMVGRIYDPTLGRFVTPDPFVQSPFEAQSLNRYSYVLNNPVTLVDPLGFQAAVPEIKYTTGGQTATTTCDFCVVKESPPTPDPPTPDYAVDPEVPPILSDPVSPTGANNIADPTSQPVGFTVDVSAITVPIVGNLVDAVANPSGVGTSSNLMYSTQRFIGGTILGGQRDFRLVREALEGRSRFGSAKLNLGPGARFLRALNIDNYQYRNIPTSAGIRLGQVSNAFTGFSVAFEGFRAALSAFQEANARGLPTDEKIALVAEKTGFALAGSAVNTLFGFGGAGVGGGIGAVIGFFSPIPGGTFIGGALGSLFGGFGASSASQRFVTGPLIDSYRSGR